LAWKPSIVSRVIVENSTSPKRSLTIASRSSSNTTVRSRFAPAFGITEQHGVEQVDPLDRLAQQTRARESW
jgi:hypothetical protein